MRRLLCSWILMLGVWLALPTAARAQTPTCDALQGDKRQLAQAILQAQHPYGCCDAAISECLARKPVCVLARRLANDICRRADAGQTREAIEGALVKRAQTMNRSGAPVPIDLSNSTVAGDADSKVTVVVYACARCPLCSKVVPSLYKQVTEGPLKAKARLLVKMFPIRTHAFSTEAATGVLVAQQLGKSWPYLLQLYSHFDDFDANKLADYAVAIGLDRAAFVGLTSDATIRARLVESKKEGIRNKVDMTPTLFLDGYRYSADFGMPTIQDLVEEEFDRLSGKSTE